MSAPSPVAAQTPAAPAGAVLRPGTGTDARYVGAELDLLANYQITRHLLGYVAYGHFFTGPFINRSGPGRDRDFVYAALQYTCSERDGQTASTGAGFAGITRPS